jgi:hypothetical protein
MVGNVTLLMQSISVSVTLLVWVMARDQCHSDVCMQDFPKNMLPLGQFANMVIGIVAWPIFFSCHNISVHFISMSITLSALLASAVILQVDQKELIAISGLSLAMICSLASYHGSLLSAFTSNLDFERALRVNVNCENKTYLMKIQKNEMRHMIGMYSLLVTVHS